jgi:hypothetical protein
MVILENKTIKFIDFINNNIFIIALIKYYLIFIFYVNNQYFSIWDSIFLTFFKIYEPFW